MDELFVRIAENSIVLSIMAFAWRMAENRAKMERDKVNEITQSYIEYVKAHKE